MKRQVKLQNELHSHQISPQIIDQHNGSTYINHYPFNNTHSKVSNGFNVQKEQRNNEISWNEYMNLQNKSQDQVRVEYKMRKKGMKHMYSKWLKQQIKDKETIKRINGGKLLIGIN